MMEEVLGLWDSHVGGFPQQRGCGDRRRGQRGPGGGLRRWLDQGKESWSRACSQQPTGMTCSEGDPAGTASWGVFSSKGVIVAGEI